VCFNTSVCVSQLSVTVTNTQDNQVTKKKGLCWVTVVEVSRDGVALLVWGLW
jgi:hypothetical protein